MGVTLQYPHWRGSCLHQLKRDMGQELQLGRDYDASVLQSLTYLLIRLIFWDGLRAIQYVTI